MSAELAQLADQVASGMAQWWPAVSAAIGGSAVEILERVRDKTTEATGDAAVGWVGRVLTRVFARKPASTPDAPSSEAGSDAAAESSEQASATPAEDAIIDAEVLETLDELAADPESRSVRRLLSRLILDQAARDPALIDTLRELVAQTPEGTVGAIGISGAVSQSNTSGVTIANTGVVRDIQASGSGR